MAQELTRPVIVDSAVGHHRRWQYSVASGLTPARLSSLLLQANAGYAVEYLTLAEEMEERSPHYAAVLNTRKRAVLGLPRSVEAASDRRRDVNLAETVETYLVKTPAFGQLLAGLLDALGKGYAAVEVRWDTQQSPWTPRHGKTRLERAYTWRDPRYFRYADNGRDLQLAPEGFGLGAVQPLPPYRFIVHEPAIKMGVPLRAGLARLAAVAYLCSHYVLEDWTAFAEVFGMPLRLGRYSSAASPEDIEVLKTAVTGLGSDAAAVLHESMRIEFQNAATGAGGADLYERLADRLDKLISKAVLGRSDAADATSGQLGGQECATEVRRDILESDAEELSNTLNEQLVRPFVDLNYGPQAAYPMIRLYVPDQEDLAGLADMLAKLVPLGLKVEQSVIRDKWGLPDPAEDAELLGVKAGISPDMPEELEEEPATNRARNRVAGTLTHDPIEPTVERLGREADPLLDALLAPVRQALNASGDLMDFREKLLTLYSDLDGRAFAALMGQALAVADAAGYWEASQSPPARAQARALPALPDMHLTVNVAAPGPTKKTIQRTADGCYEVHETPDAP
jgi:phage gp29-like protein